MLERSTTETTVPVLQRGLARRSGSLRAVVSFIRLKPLGAAGALVFIILVVIALLAPTISPLPPAVPSTLVSNTTRRESTRQPSWNAGNGWSSRMMRRWRHPVT